MESGTDLLTGLLNRASMKREIDNLILYDATKSIAIMILDLDNFKLINEALGPDIGDSILTLVATKLKEVTHEAIKIARASDNYILCFPEHNHDSILEYANAILHSCSEPLNINNQPIHLSASIGIAIYPEDGTHGESLMKNAEIAMRKAKESENSKICFFDDGLSSNISNEFILINDLHEAMLNDQFILAFQPQIDLKTGAICAAEALVRWQHPSKGLLYPGSFIAIAEKTDFIVPLNEHIMRMVFKEVSSANITIPISINISALQFQNGFHLVEYLETLMKTFQINATQIELEITESMLMTNSEHTMAVVSALHHLGFKISIDDFGIGFSSFSYLTRFPFDKIKIDRSFISGLPANSANATITKSIIAMFHALNKIIVAKGAETLAEVEFLKQEKCDIVQGYYYYKPNSFNELTKRVEKSVLG